MCVQTALTLSMVRLPHPHRHRGDGGVERHHNCAPGHGSGTDSGDMELALRRFAF